DGGEVAGLDQAGGLDGDRGRGPLVLQGGRLVGSADRGRVEEQPRGGGGGVVGRGHAGDVDRDRLAGGQGGAECRQKVPGEGERLVAHRAGDGEVRWVALTGVDDPVDVVARAGRQRVAQGHARGDAGAEVLDGDGEARGLPGGDAGLVGGLGHGHVRGDDGDRSRGPLVLQGGRLVGGADHGRVGERAREGGRADVGE